MAEDDCGHATSTNTGGAIFRTGHTFVLTHGTITPAIASTVLGFKLNFIQLPCNSADVKFKYLYSYCTEYIVLFRLL